MNVIKTPAGETAEVLIPAPSEEPYQKVQWEIVGALSQRVRSVDGGRVIAVRSAGPQFRMRVLVEPTLAEIPKPRGRVPVPLDALACLASNADFARRNPRTAQLARELKAKDPEATVKNILRWIKNNMHYRYDPELQWIQSKPLGGIDSILHTRLGDCGGHSDLFVCLCRQAGIPARILWGPVKIKGRGSMPRDSGLPADLGERFDFSGHAWAEVYLDGWGWIPLEPQDAETPLGRVPQDYVPFLRISAGNDGTHADAGLALSNVGMMNYFPMLEKSESHVRAQGNGK
jgi:transglutaminase-like putative cysteine protease